VPLKEGRVSIMSYVITIANVILLILTIDYLNTQVYGYRMSLWAEHLGILEKAFDEPQSLECMKLVNKTSRHNWKAYVSEESKEMRGHLMQYPIQVSKSGEVSALQGHETFPDVGGKVLGASTNLPDVLTT